MKERITVYKLKNGVTHSVYVDLDKLDSLSPVITNIYDSLLDLSESDYKYIMWNDIFMSLRNLVSLKAKDGVYLCNIFPKITKDFSVSDFKGYMNYLVSADSSEEPILKRKCRDCGKEFYIFNSEIDFFRLRGLSLPKRCKDCRQARREAALNKSNN